MKALKFFLPMLLLLLLTVFATAEDRSPLSFNELPDFTVTKGSVTYQRYCLFCHGQNGEGDGQNAFSLPVRPADLTVIVPVREDKQLLAVISNGGANNSLSSAMPAYQQTLSTEQIKQVMEYIKNLSQRSEDEDLDQSKNTLLD